MPSRVGRKNPGANFQLGRLSKLDQDSLVELFVWADEAPCIGVDLPILRQKLAHSICAQTSRRDGSIVELRPTNAQPPSSIDTKMEVPNDLDEALVNRTEGLVAVIADLVREGR
jgi:hypothetical protein